jgi:eukaryotic-like serine/threonine-protein kinase
VPLSPTSWLFAARASDGSGLLLEHLPLGHRFRIIARHDGVRQCGSNVDAGTAVAGGAHGYVASLREGALREEALPGAVDVSAVAVDLLGRPWAASAGGLWTRDDTWQRAWSEPSWKGPIVSILADVGRIAAVTVDGGIVQAESTPRLQAR